jgi:predicted dehydrogenase
MTSRRTFLKQAAVGTAAGTLAAHGPGAQAAESQPVGVGLIGVGIRGFALMQGINESRHARLAAISDICDHYVQRARQQLQHPDTPIEADYRRLLDRRDVDAVVIATPDHWHAQMTLDALDAGKDVYVEKPLTYSLEEAIAVRDKARQTGRVTQVGYQRRTLDHFYQARQLVAAGALGQITQLQLWSSRNRTTPPWRAYDSYSKPGLPPQSGPESVDWSRFQANRPARPYDARRFFHWQCYRQYSTGIFGILMSHPLDAANLVLGLDIPETCCATGGIYKYDDGRTVPDTCNCLLNYPDRQLTVSFVGSSNNSMFNQEAHYRGTLGTMELGVSWLRLYAEGKNALYQKYADQQRDEPLRDLRTQPVWEVPVDYRWSTIPHLDDFFVNVQRRGKCKAPIEECFKAMVAVAMAIKSYETGRTVRWDAERQAIRS